MDRPCVARGNVEVAGFGSCINVSGLSLEPISLPAIMDISAHPISLADRPHRAIWVTSFRMRREDRPPSLRSISQTSAGSLSQVSSVQFLCSILRPFLRPDLHCSRAPRGGAVKAGRRADLASLRTVSRPRLDGPEQGARLRRIGTSSHPSASPRSCAPWPGRPRRCGRACWRARSPARWDGAASTPPRSRT
jgi:hypothetical protein